VSAENKVSTESVLQDALLLLDEVSSYLKRLPTVPVTLQLARKVDGFTADPHRRTAIRIAKETASELEMRSQTRSAVTFTPAGLPLIKVAVNGDVVRISLAETFAKHADVGSNIDNGLVNTAIRQLESGVELTLDQKKLDF
jgi:hypothetical protein